MFRFQGLPWQDRPLTSEQLLEQVHEEIAQCGTWTKTGEYRMGGGPTVSIRPAPEEGRYVLTGPEFVPVLLRQRNHAKDHRQADRAVLYESLVNRATEESA
jgi:hypothetical protein